ncbi:DivIVA domain-containing protein [Micromonospora matsumotoense]|uniref:DivIVA domain-containing protein n=1 Tax=Micromonospora matsumotoense TaxID=121616 RepID=A0A1C5AW89_9ACTN|nr:DivIVA domain-containing protein [Micromonospora matsumotoense]SCF49311.1 DivIVA domain-containing protein [Micromonospora matsumotoense]
MGQTLLIVVVALTVAAVVFGVTVLISGRDGLAPTEPDGRAVPLPGGRPLRESDVGALRFDTALRGYRMDQVDQAMRRAGYDIGYKSELIGVLEAEVVALREGRTADADVLRRTREEAVATPPDASPATPAPDAPGPEGPTVEVEPIDITPTPTTDRTETDRTETDRTETDRAGDRTETDRADADRPGGAVARSEPV